jgi:hypothetical protein
MSLGYDPEGTLTAKVRTVPKGNVMESQAAGQHVGEYGEVRHG